MKSMLCVCYDDAMVSYTFFHVLSRLLFVMLLSFLYHAAATL